MHTLHPEIFRAYDIRGIVDKTLTQDTVYQLGLTLGTETQKQGENALIVACDGRISGPTLKSILIQGITNTGCHVIDIGKVSTPMLYFAGHTLSARSCVMLTGSHNPKDYNGLKMMIAGRTLSGEEIQQLYQNILAKDFYAGKGGLTFASIDENYIDYICEHVHLKKKLKIVIDCGNGITGKTAPALFRKLGAEVIELFCEVDGNFPNHEPDPSQPENLKDLKNAVLQHQADIGLAFDGDGDRLGVVTDQGEIILADRQLMLFAKSVLQNQKNAEIIFDVKCTRYLPEIIKAHGGKPVMWKTGHSFIKNKMYEVNSPLAGEMSGHIFFNDRWFGFDDGLYAGARLLEIISQETANSHEIFSSFPNSINTPELKLEMPESQKFSFIEEFIKKSKFDNAAILTIDGIRVDFEDSFGLIRASNTSPYLVMRFEADTSTHLARIQNLFRQQLLAIDQSLKLPF